MLNTKTGEFSRQEIEHPYETVHRLSQWLRMLASLSQSAEGERVAEDAVKALGAAACCIDIADPSRTTDFSFAFCTTGLELTRVKHIAATLRPKVELAGETILIDDVDSRFLSEKWISEKNVNKYLGVPLFSRANEVAGVAAVFGVRSRRFNEEDEWWLRCAGQILLASLNQDELERKLKGLENTLAPAAVSHDGSNGTSENQPASPLILVVDDDHAVNDMLTQMLEALGYEVRQAFNGVEAMQMFQPAAHRLVITDVAMPLMNGWELVAALKVRAPKLPIIVVSGYSTGQWNTNSIAKLGVSAVMTKPLSMAELESTVARLLNS